MKLKYSIKEETQNPTNSVNKTMEKRMGERIPELESRQGSEFRSEAQ